LRRVWKYCSLIVPHLMDRMERISSRMALRRASSCWTVSIGGPHYCRLLSTISRPPINVKTQTPLLCRRPEKIASLLLAMLGCYFVVGGYQFDLLRLNKVGIVSGVASSLFFTFYALYGEKGLKKYDPWTLILYGFGFGALFYWILFSPMKFITGGYSLKMWIAFLYIAIFATLIPFGFYFKGIERVRATRASITATWEPVIAGFAAYVVLGEVLYPLQILGGIGVIAAVVLLQIGREKAAPSTPLEIRKKE